MPAGRNGRKLTNSLKTAYNRVSWTAPSATNITFSYKYHLQLQISPSATNITFSYTYHLQLQISPSATNITFSYKYHLQLQISPSATNITFSYKYHLQLQISCHQKKSKGSTQDQLQKRTDPGTMRSTARILLSCYMSVLFGVVQHMSK